MSAPSVGVLAARYTEQVQVAQFSAFSAAVSGMIRQEELKSGVGSGSKADSSSVDGEYESKRIIVKSTGSAPDMSEFGASQIAAGPDGVYVLQFGSVSAAKSCADALADDPRVAYAEPDVLLSLCETVSEEPPLVAEEPTPRYLSWGPEYIEADLYEKYLLDNGYGANSAVVAVVDSGVAEHEALAGKIAPGGYDFIDMDDDPSNDGHSHGTHVAGIVADCTQNLNVKILPVRVLGDNGTGYASTVGNGVKYAADKGAKVINLSLTGPHSMYYEDSITYAMGKNAAVVAAAGNTGGDTADLCPSHIDAIIVVSSIAQNGLLASTSCRGNSVDFAAPGVLINSCVPGPEKYAVKSGTSMSAAFVSAAAAMYCLFRPTATTRQINNFLIDTAFDAGDRGFDIKYGYGIPKLSLGYTGDLSEPAITLDKTSVSLNFLDTAKLTARVSKPRYYVDTDVVWQSSNTKIANVDSRGNIIATGRGQAVITAATRDGRCSARCTVTVNYTIFQWLIVILLFGWIWYV